MSWEFVTVEKDAARVASGADVQEHATTPRSVTMIDHDLAAIPNRSFVVTQSLVLGIALAGNGQRRRRVEVRVDAVARVAGL